MQTSFLLAETRISLNQAARQCQVNVSTVWRWTMRGVRGVTLDSFNLGAKRFTTQEALERFSTACTFAANSNAAVSPRTNRRRRADVSQAELDCDQEGIKCISSVQ